MSDMYLSIALLIISYLIGSIPFGLLLGKIKKIDIRQKGSGNIGSTNAYRVLGLKYGLISVLLDTLKGMVVMILVYFLNKYTSFESIFRFNGDDYFIVYGISAVLGHDFSIFLKFRGGKGVATSLGAITILSPWFGLIALVTFIIIVVITRYVSLGSTLAATSVVILSLFLFLPNMYLNVIALGILACLIYYKHISNYKRLAQGKENKLF